jgi:plastocyanin
MMTRIRPLVLALLLIAGVTACGSSSSGAASGGGSGSSGGAVQSGTAKVTIQGFAFHPSSLTVKAGTKVTFTNEDSTTHTATSQGDSTIDSGNLAKGQTYTVTLSKAGTYNYICTIHQYMHGSITVQ